MSLARLFTAGAGLVSPLMDAFGAGGKAEDAYERFLRSRGVSSADIQKQVSQDAGVQADKAELAKQNVMGILQGQGLGNSIIGAQAGMKADIEKNKFIQDRMSQLYNAQTKQEMQNRQDLADFQLGRAGARRQGFADAGAGILSGAGTLFDWLDQRKKQ